MVGLPFVVLIIGILQVSLDFIFFSQIDYAANKASHEIRTGNVRIQEMSVNDFKAKFVCPNVVAISCDSVYVSSDVITTATNRNGSWEDLSPNVFDTANLNWCTGGAADTVLMRIAMPVPFFASVWSGAVPSKNGASRLYVAAATFRNDPYGLPPRPDGC